MKNHFRPLRHTRLHRSVDIINPSQFHNSLLTMESPAIQAMTDLSLVQPICINHYASINQANVRMISNGVRMLFVITADNKLDGLITASDTLGEKPLRYMNEFSCTFDEVQVFNIMTPFEEIEVLFLKDVQHAQVGDIVSTLEDVGRQHALVSQEDSDTQTQYICGIFSTSQISRFMNMRIEVAELPSSFSAIHNALG